VSRKTGIWRDDRNGPVVVAVQVRGTVHVYEHVPPPTVLSASRGTLRPAAEDDDTDGGEA
jgi:hypothetical protein